MSKSKSGKGSGSWFGPWKQRKKDAGEWTKEPPSKTGRSGSHVTDGVRKRGEPVKPPPAQVVECPHCGGTHKYHPGRE